MRLKCRVAHPIPGKASKTPFLEEVEYPHLKKWRERGPGPVPARIPSPLTVSDLVERKASCNREKKGRSFLCPVLRPNCPERTPVYSREERDARERGANIHC